MVATSQPLAVETGLSVLQEGGNAVDAAIAMAAVLTVVEPTGNGLGSDAFAMVWDRGQLHGLNGSGRAPAGWSAERFAGLERMPSRGWDSVTVPGAVSAWVDLWRRFGRLNFTRLLEPAISHAENGFEVTPKIAALWARGAGQLFDQPGFADTFMPNGKVPAAGERFRNPDLAKSLSLIGETEGRAFYSGALAERIAAEAARHEAALNIADLGTHQSDWCTPLRMDFRGVRIHELPPNGQGIAALMALGMLEHLPIGLTNAPTVDDFHLQIEAMKIAFADLHRFVADPLYMDVPPEALLDPDYLRRRAGLISTAFAQDFRAGAPRSGGTVYLTAADRTGMMVSLIQSNYSGFGAGVVVPGTGIHLQNRGSGFSLQPGHPNFVGPGKRPFHTIIPAFVTRGALPLMSLGVMGGPMQAQGHVQMIVLTELFGQLPQSAIDASRWRFVDGRRVAVEAGMDESIIAELAARGHDLERAQLGDDFAFGGAQIIRVTSEGYVGGSDRRKDGLAAGY